MLQCYTVAAPQYNLASFTGEKHQQQITKTSGLSSCLQNKSSEILHDSNCGDTCRRKYVWQHFLPNNKVTLLTLMTQGALSSNLTLAEIS